MLTAAENTPVNANHADLLQKIELKAQTIHLSNAS